MLSDICVRIRELRESKKLTQEQLADRLHISRATVNSYEHGVSYPSAEVLYEMCIVLDTTSDYLLGLENKRKISVDGLSSRNVDMLCELRDIFAEQARRSRME